MKLNPLVHCVIWPAVAGNILWAFLQVAADTKIRDASHCPRLAALLFVGVYLAIDWVNTENEKKINDSYWMFDLPLATALATFAVGTQSGTWWSNYALMIAFVVAIFGHCKGAWDGTETPTSCVARATFAVFNAVGLILLLIGIFAPAPYSLWLTPSAIFLVVALYLSLRQKVLSRWP
jgi:hypothetical protein